MGTNSSREFDHTDITNNDSLLLFAGELPVHSNDQFWETFLTFTLKTPGTRNLDELMGKRLKPICKMLFVNNPKTGNFAALINFFVSSFTSESLSETRERSNLNRCRCFNALFITRCFVKYVIEHAGEKELFKQFVPLPDASIKEEDCVKFQDYVYVILKLLIDVPITDNTYDLHFEIMNFLLVVLSASLFANVPPNELEVYKCIAQAPDADKIMHTLLTCFIDQPKRSYKSGGIFLGLASDLLNFFTFQRENDEEIQSPLANHAVLLTLILINHSTLKTNPYRSSISSYAVNINGLYEVLCRTIRSEESTLLLYHLLHCNTNFKNHLLAKSDVELMLLPILRRIYNVADSSCHQMYMSLIILLILTEDQSFNKTIHNVQLKGVSWYTERMITEVSLGGLIVLIVARTIQYNLLRMRDKYLHTNCLAALANMSSQFTNLHPYVCQRLISLFDVLTKTRTRANVDVVAVEEAIRIILEVINSCLSHQLIHNTNLVYTLLYNKDVFQPFQKHEAFHDVIQNIDLIITYFSKKLEKENEPNLDVDQILEKVRRWSMQWPRDLLKKFPDLKFKYVEEEKPEEFFIPYVWSLVGKFSGIYWNAALYKL